jgi:hypothetical protein
MELINDFKRVNRMIVSLGKSGAKFNQTMHLIAYNCLVLTDNTGDIRPMQHLHDVLTPANQRALILWAREFGKYTYDAEAKQFKYAKGKTTRRIDAEAVSPLAYEKAKIKKATPTFNLAEALDRLIQRGRKAGVTGKAWDTLLQARQVA